MSVPPLRGAARELLAERFEAQLLAGPPAADPLAVAERLLAIQGQDQRGARLAIRARTAGLTAAGVDRCLTEERSLVITWLNRGTLHLVRSEDYPWLQALTTPPLATTNRTRLRQEGVGEGDQERGVAAIEQALTEDGPRTRDQLAAAVQGAGAPSKGPALVHLLMLASLRGLIVRGPMLAGKHAYALVRDWLPKPARFDRDRALPELARRYLAGHGPAGDRDLARWSGLPLRDTRAALEAIASELDQREDGLLQLRGGKRDGELPAPRLLGAFDPCLLGWTSRATVLGDHADAIVSGGIFRPFALAGGRAVGLWKLARGEVALEPFAKIARDAQAALDAEATDVVRFLA